MTTNFPTPHSESLPPTSPADALLRGEDTLAYHQLRRRLVAEMRPRGVVEEVLVGDVCDLVWEAARYRRIRARALEARMDLGVARIVEPHEDLGSHGLSEGWARGEERDVRLVDKALAAAGLGPEHVAACAVLAQIGDVERLDRLIAATEIRRAAALREIERHRAARLRDLAVVGDVADETAAEDRGRPATNNASAGLAETAGVSPADASGGPDLWAGSPRSEDEIAADEVAEAEVFERWGGLG